MNVTTRRTIVGVVALIAVGLLITIVRGEYRAHVLSRERQRINSILTADLARYRNVRVVPIKRFANGLQGTVSSREDLDALYKQLDAAGVHDTVKNVEVKTR
jgi:hypothetical protein